MRRGQILRHEVIVGVERRRFWPDEMKLSILREVGVCGATVTDIALRHDVTRQHIYQWRRQMKDKGLWPELEGISFLALDAPEQPVTSLPKTEGNLPAEIGFANGRTLRCPPGMAEADIMGLIRLVETA
ncbi:transposase [Epibacterium ulvae]|uniref:transposase n=1 Tax=Epibacterium ulvae TaxID=1156985 RepID=UPI001BFBFD58|nr:transposase [Epibacterium ulvae]MBT8154973.1 transposase [Epibacterium ulvae]